MYKVFSDGNLLYDPRVEELEVFDKKLSLEVNTAGGFDFKIYPSHPMYNAIKRLKSSIEVYQDNHLLFRGRVLDDEHDFYNAKKVICEGDLAFFNDSIIRPFEFQGSIAEFLQWVIDRHNEQVGAAQQFVLGDVTITTSTDYVNRSSIEPMSAWEVINTRLLDLIGGYIMVRRENKINYIDYLQDSEYRSLQEIELGENLLDLKKDIKGQDIITALIPYGARLEDEEGNETDQRLTIEAVNNGKDYVFNQEAVDKYGWIFGTKTWDDVTLSNNLLTRANEELAKRMNLQVAIEVNAIDLSMTDTQIDNFRIFEYVKVNSPAHLIEDYLLISKLDLDLDNPQNNKLMLGLDYATFTERQNETEKAIKNVSVIKGPKGDKGERGPEGPQGIQGPAGDDGQAQYVHLRYSANANGSSFTDTPNSNTKYIGIAVTNSQTAPTSYTSFTWSKYVGEDGQQGQQGVQGPAGSDGQPTYTWVKYADTKTGGGMSDSPDGKRFIGLAFNKITQSESNVASDYQWSEMPQNIEVGGVNRALSPVEIGYNIGSGLVSNNAYRSFTTAVLPIGEYIISHKTDMGVRLEPSANVTFLDGSGTYNFTEPLRIEVTTESSFNVSMRKSDTSDLGDEYLTLEEMRFKIEKGNTATDWTEAPEDTQAKLDEKAGLDYVTEVETLLNSNIEQEAGAIRSEVERDYTLVSEFEEYRSNQSTQFEQLSDSFNFNFSELQDFITSVDGETKVQFEDIQKYIRFIDGKIVIGVNGDSSRVEIMNNRISFIQSGVEVAYISNQTMEITHGIFVESATISDYKFEKIPDTEILSITWVGS